MTDGNPNTIIPLFDSTCFKQDLANCSEQKHKIALYRDVIITLNENLFRRFSDDDPIEDLVSGRAYAMDEILHFAWAEYFDLNDIHTSNDIALIAVGGYGRGELHPFSDVDLMVLLRHHNKKTYDDQTREFIAFLWDIKIDVGHSVRSLKDCTSQAKADITVATNMMESRLLIGDRQLFKKMQAATGPRKVWPGDKFFSAKRKEQETRHHRYHDTAYNLEPNIKEGPGGLRDIQMIGWVAKRHFDADTLHELVVQNFLTQDELVVLLEGQNWLWKIRFALHMITKRREDRILFDYQKDLATLFGYEDTHVIAVEQFMQRYYKTVMTLERLNEMLLQLFQEAILDARKRHRIRKINDKFQSCQGYIEIIDQSLFEKQPVAILELFLLLEKNPKLKGVRATTIRQVRNNLHRFDDTLRESSEARKLFMEIIRQPHGVTHELRRMNRYGVLAAYLPEFANIVGRMQYDLFHVYTVDEHTLFVVRNLRRLTVPEFYNELPLCSDIIRDLAKPELVYIAGLYHDIAKGRGGDHSELGSTDAKRFCLNHGLIEYDAKLVAWLVNSHLLMSTTAQKKDISDPVVIHEFAETMGDKLHLDCLYLLTVADIRGTSPSLWNSFKASLLEELYRVTKTALQRGITHAVIHQERVDEVRTAALKSLQKTYSAEDIDKVWKNLRSSYFLRYHPDEIAWQTASIINTTDTDLPLIKISDQDYRGSTSIFVYTKDTPYLFASTTAALGNLDLNTLDARIVTTNNGYAINTYLVHEPGGKPVSDANRKQQIIEEMRKVLSAAENTPAPEVNRLPAREHKFMEVKTRIVFEEDKKGLRTVLKLRTADRAGLLSRVGQAFKDCEIQLHNARIATFGACAEDTFIITDLDDKPLSEDSQFAALKERIEHHLTR